MGARRWLAPKEIAEATGALEGASQATIEDPELFVWSQKSQSEVKEMMSTVAGQVRLFGYEYRAFSGYPPNTGATAMLMVVKLRGVTMSWVAADFLQGPVGPVGPGVVPGSRILARGLDTEIVALRAPASSLPTPL